jgi:hypothetical protein
VQKHEGSDFCYQRSEHPELLYTLVPGLPRCQGNFHGYRDMDHTYEKPAGVKRVVIIGDSVGIGMGIALEKTFSRQLERQLNERLGDSEQSFEVVVLGQAGYSMSQELFLLEHEAPRYDPDLVIWVYVLNDPAHPVYHNANGELGRFFFKPRFHTADFVERKLFEIKEGQARKVCPNEYHAFLHCAYREEISQMIGRIGELSTEYEMPVVFAIHPVFEGGSEFSDYSLTEVHAQLRENAEAAGLDVLDLLHAYTPYPLTRVVQVKKGGRVDLWHPNKEGADIVANALFDKVVARDYLESGGDRQLTH